MLDRNRRIKTAPERFQESNQKFDILITVEERVYDQVMNFITYTIINVVVNDDFINFPGP